MANIQHDQADQIPKSGINTIRKNYDQNWCKEYFLGSEPVNYSCIICEVTTHG